MLGQAENFTCLSVTKTKPTCNPALPATDEISKERKLNAMKQVGSQIKIFFLLVSHDKFFNGVDQRN
jgi:hypothetical protein